MNAEGKDKNYGRAILRNHITGKKEEIILLDLHDEVNENLSPIPSQLDLHADLAKAFETFTPYQKLILLRVLLQGQSVEEATKGSKMSRRYWAEWMHDFALPYLRGCLGDYIEGGKVRQ